MHAASDAPDRLRELARRLRRETDPFRSDPERSFAARQDAAAKLRALADDIEGRDEGRRSTKAVEVSR